MDFAKEIKEIGKRAEYMGRLTILIQLKNKIDTEIEVVDALIKDLERGEKNANQ